MNTRTADRGRPVHRPATAPHSLVDEYDTVMLDLDGVVYVGAHAVPHAAETLDAVRGDGVRLAYVTNNASRTPAQVAAHLTELGVPARGADVVTSAQAVARLVAEAVDPGARVLLVGAAGLAAALAEHGLSVVSSARDSPAAVVQGFDPEISWARLAEGAYAVQAGAPWFASNADLTVPTARGMAPGNGAFVAAIEAATGTSPVVAGKPEPALFDETMLRVGGDAPLVVGDRLDTDIEGANRIAAESLAVLTGVVTFADIASAEPMLRPTYLGPDLRALTRPQPELARDGDWFVCAGVRVRLAGGVLELDGRGSSARDGYDRAVAALRAGAGAAWDGSRDGADEPDVSAVTAYLDGCMR